MNYYNTMMIEPRLLEYIAKKKNFSKNNIRPCIPLETEYAITSNDIRRIKKYLSNTDTQNNFAFPNETKDFKIVPPNINYKNKLHYDKVEEKGQFEKLPHVPNFNGVINYAEYMTQLPVPLSKHVHKSKRVYTDSPNECINKIREQYYNGKQLDPTIMSELMLGIPQHTRKSYGYNDSFEHSFDYIDNDIQEPDHVVMPFPRGGISARLENKKQIKH